MYNKKQFKGLGFASYESIPIPNVISKTNIFTPIKKNNISYLHENIAPKNTNFDVWLRGEQGTYNDFYRFFATFSIYLKKTNWQLGYNAELNLLEICEFLRIEKKGANPALIYDALNKIANNKYKITTYGKKDNT